MSLRCAHFIENLSKHYSSENSTAKLLPESHNASIWAVLVAGSSGWYNYRHQVTTADTKNNQKFRNNVLNVLLKYALLKTKI